MIVIPAIDIIDGKCVRLYQGDFDRSVEVESDPFYQLEKFIEDGAQIIHIVDLDGARHGDRRQFKLIHELAQKSSVPIQVGGGIRSMEIIEKLVETGVDRIVLGTAAVENEKLLKEALEKYGDKIVVGIDAKKGRVATRGWEKESELQYIEFAKHLEELGVKTLVYTDISRDGTLTGPNLEELSNLLQSVNCRIVASGGIKDNADIKSLEEIGIKEAIVGKAIYDGKINVKGEDV